MELDLQALSIWREVKDQRNEATALMTLAWAYSEMKEPEQSFASAMAALGLIKATGDPELEGGIERSMMLGFRKQHRPEEAIFFGLEAVNSYQQIRQNIAGLDKELQAAFAQSKSGSYRMLAELLVEAGRLGQAEHILDLLKEQELNDLVPNAVPGAAAKFELMQLSPAQQDAEKALPDLEKRARAIEESSLAYARIQAKPVHTPEDDAQLKALHESIQKESTEIHNILFNTVFPELDRQSAPGQAAVESTKSLLRDSLAKLGPRVMGIRLLLGDDHAYAIVVTANERKKFVLQATPADIRSKTFEALKAVGSPATDPRPQLTQLYSMIVAPLEDELKSLEAASGAQGSVPTLLWSLDDALRYVPMGALYDGNHYLVERFHNVLFTPESYGHMTDSPIQKGNPPSALAMGLSKSYGGLPALPRVMPELDAVVHDPSVPESHGPMDGKLLPNEQFTLAALKTELGAGKGFPVVHIASHFVLVAGSGDEPFLMMGGDNAGDANGFEWNLSDMENSPVAFHGTRLLTLSACSTAKDYKSRNGLEMDSLGWWRSRRMPRPCWPRSGT
jgi:CHAT domain-containing protein